MEKDAVDGKEPTNWKSKFGGNAWKYSEKEDNIIYTYLMLHKLT